MPRVNNTSSVYQPSSLNRNFNTKLDQSRTVGRSRHVLMAIPLNAFSQPSGRMSLLETYDEGTTWTVIPNQPLNSLPVNPTSSADLYTGLRGAYLWTWKTFDFNSGTGLVQPSIQLYTSADNGESWVYRGRTFQEHDNLASVSFLYNSNWYLNFPSNNTTIILPAFTVGNDGDDISTLGAYSPSNILEAKKYNEFQDIIFEKALFAKRSQVEYKFDGQIEVGTNPGGLLAADIAFIRDTWAVLGFGSDEGKIHFSEGALELGAFESSSRSITFSGPDNDPAPDANPVALNERIFYFKSNVNHWGVVVRVEQVGTGPSSTVDIRVAPFKTPPDSFIWYGGSAIRNIPEYNTISFSADPQTGSVLMYIHDPFTSTHTFYALEENPEFGVDVGFVQKNQFVDSDVEFKLGNNVSPVIINDYSVIANPKFYQGLTAWQIRPGRNYQWSNSYLDARIGLKNTVTFSNEIKNLIPGNRYLYKFKLDTQGSQNVVTSATLKHGGVLSSATTVNNPFSATFGALANNAFGTQVAVSTTRHAGSSPTRTSFGATSSGQVGLFNSSTNTLVHSDIFAIRTGETNADFGTSIDMCESYLIVGAPGSTVDGKADTGRAYIYSTVDGSLLFTLENPRPTTPASFGDQFGKSVSICESYAIVGAPNDYGNTNTVSTGAAYIFSTADGSLLYTLENPNTYSTGVQDLFGSAVAITESYAIVSAPNEDAENRSFVRVDNVGRTYIYSTATGNRIHSLVNPSLTANSRFGSALDICESYAVIVGGGNCYVYDPAAGALVRTITNPNVNTANASDGFGTSVSITDRYLLIGAPSEDVNSTDSGSAYLYDSSTGVLLHALHNPNAYSSATFDYFGSSVALSEVDSSGSIQLIVGAPGEDQAGASTAGKAYVYTISESNLVSQVTDFSDVQRYFNATSDSLKLDFNIVSQTQDQAFLSDLDVTDITSINLDYPIAAVNLETASVNTVYTTSDLRDWTARTLPQTATWSWLARGKITDTEQDLMLIGTNGEVCVSTDSGISWSNASNLPALRVAGTWHQVVNVYSTSFGGSFWVAITKPTSGTTTQYAFSDDLGTNWVDWDFPVAAAWDYVDSYVYFDGTTTQSHVLAHSNTSGTLLRSFNGGQQGFWADISSASLITNTTNPKYAKIEYMGTQYNGSSFDVKFIRLNPNTSSSISYSYSSDAGTTWSNGTLSVLNGSINSTNNLYYDINPFDPRDGIVMVQRSNLNFFQGSDLPTSSITLFTNAFDSSPFFDFITEINKHKIAGGRSSQLYIKPFDSSLWIPLSSFPANMKIVV